MAALTDPAGRFSLEEFHPLTDVLRDEDLSVARSYFNRTPHHHEHARWPFLEAQADGSYRMPAGTPSLPPMDSLRATRA